LAPRPIYPVARDSPIPLYFQLAEALRKGIEQGEWATGGRLPSEFELCDSYEVSRSVVRQALAHLRDEGLIQKTKGRGAFVAERRTGTWLVQSREGFYQDEVGRAGVTVTSRIVGARRLRLPRWAAQALGDDDEGSTGVELERLRSVDGRLALYVVNYVPDRYADVVLGLKDHESLYDRLGAAHNIAVGGGRRSIEAVPARKRLAKLLDVSPSTALLMIQSVSWDTAGRPFDCYQGWLRTDRMRVQIEATSTNPGGGRLDQHLLHAVGA
jgi:DNA-binding GntR family transcriptional regulator